MARLLLPILIACLCPALRAQDADRPPRGDSDLRELVSQEKRSPTTAKNVRRRHEDLIRFILRGGKPDRYMPRRTGMRIKSLLDEDKAAEAAKLIHAVILGLEQARQNENKEADAGFAPPGGAGDLERIIDEEKRTPATERTVVRRYQALIRAALATGTPIRYLPPGTMAPIDELLAQDSIKEAAARLHAVILEVGDRLSSDDNAARAPAATGGGDAAPPAQTAADKASASILYFKAMQEYAGGKPDRAWDLLQSGAKLDPGNQDIAKAIERLAKER